jgi:SNF2 family DNA or RNA helicase
MDLDRSSLHLAHHIRNRYSKIFEAACAIRARYRWCLTGTPIHNRIDDYGALLSFIGVPPFTSKALFDYWVTTPINKTNSEGVRRLKKLVMATCLRRTKNSINNQLKLPQRIDREEAIELDKTERELYNFFKVRTSSLIAGMFSKDSWSAPHQQRNILPLINFLRRICDHGEELLPPAALRVWLSWDSSAIDWKMMGSCVSKCDSCKADIDNLVSPDSHHSEFSCLHVICPKCAITKDEDDSAVDENLCPVCNRESIPSVSDRLTGLTSKETEVMTVDYRPSSKVKALLANLLEEQRLNISDLKENPIKRYLEIRI